MSVTDATEAFARAVYELYETYYVKGVQSDPEANERDDYAVSISVSELSNEVLHKYGLRLATDQPVKITSEHVFGEWRSG